jgi:hypothetical protein
VYIRDVEFVLAKEARKEHRKVAVYSMLVDRDVTWKYRSTLKPQGKEPSLPDTRYGLSGGLLPSPGYHYCLLLFVIF